MTALEQLDRLLAEPRRQAVLPRELSGSRPAAYRALRRRCDDGTLLRIGRGVYARRQARLFDVVPEILPKLGYTILPKRAVTNLNFKGGGNVWRIDRPCRRLIIKHGVAAVFESPKGKMYKAKRPTPSPMNKPPPREEVERHFSSFDRCHSYARAEKDLIVQKALQAWEAFQHPDAIFALDGGTCLVRYHRQTQRFSEDIDIRVVLREDLEHGSPTERVEAFRSVSAAFARHIHRELPFLETTRKGRFRKRDGRFESHIFRYHGRQPHPEVVEGLKLELVQEPARLAPVRAKGLQQREVRLIDPFEIAMGKWQALSTWLAGRKYTGGDYVRHPADLCALSSTLQLAYRFRPDPLVAMVAERRGPGIVQALRELQDPVWEANYDDYLRRMGSLPIGDSAAFAYPTWKAALQEVARLSLELDLLPAQDRPEVWELAAMDPPEEERR